MATQKSPAPLLDQLQPEERAALLASAVKKSFVTGDFLMREGTEGNSMIVLERGSVEVRRGKKTIATLTSGAAVGEMALLDPAPRSASVVAKADGLCWELGHDQFLRLVMDGDPAGLRALQILTATVCSRLQDVNQLVQEAVVKPPKENLWGRIWKSVSQAGRA